MSTFCEVALPVPLDRTFTYAVREFEQPLRGARVIVPFRNEKMIGVINLVAVGDGFIAHARVGADRRSGSFTGIIAECLNALSQARIDGRQNLRACNPALSAPAVQPDFECHDGAALRRLHISSLSVV